MNRDQIFEDMLKSVATEPRNAADWPTEDEARALVTAMFTDDEEAATAALGEGVTLLRQGKIDGGASRRIIADGVRQFVRKGDGDDASQEAG